MAIIDEVEAKRAEIKTDSYPMSIGELVSMYKDKEIHIYPEFQRFFRWTDDQKSRLVESILLGIPIPSIFVSQRKDGVWDVVDGLQRLSTIFQLQGLLLDKNGSPKDPLIMKTTKLLPSLNEMKWENAANPQKQLPDELKLLIKRSKLDIKIILRESDTQSKYELFQRLNTGGAQLSEQEVRNCLLIMVKPDFFEWIQKLALKDHFKTCVQLSDRLLEEKYDLDLLVRFLVLFDKTDEQLREISEIGTFLDDSIVEMANNPQYDRNLAEVIFDTTFKALASACADTCFQRYNSHKKRFLGSFLVSAYEAVAFGVATYYQHYSTPTAQKTLDSRVKKLWRTQAFLNGIGSGVRASTRIPITTRVGREVFRP